jgi:hypothetical protein
MRFFALIVFFLSAGCSAGPESASVTSVARVTEIAQAPDLSKRVLSVWRKLEDVSVEMCRSELELRDHSQCDFELIFDKSNKRKANAKSWIGKNGSSFLSINRALLKSFRNDDEIAFVLAHEAAHTIATHHSLFGAKGLTNSFSITKANSHTSELEADVIGTMIAIRAGFNANRGAAILKNLSRASHRSSTHPGADQRLDLIYRATNLLNSGQEIEID